MDSTCSKLGCFEVLKINKRELKGTDPSDEQKSAIYGAEMGNHACSTEGE